MRWTGTCYRGHDPGWAWAPTSGAGAAARGGRFNPKGVPALYLALGIPGLFAEMGHGLGHRFAPLTVCSYTVDTEDVIDLTTSDGRDAARVSLADMACGWALDLAAGRRPPSWRIAESLIRAGASGILVPSFASGATDRMTNLVLWTWGPDPPHRVEVHDPGGKLPVDQASWPSLKP